MHSTTAATLSLERDPKASLCSSTVGRAGRTVIIILNPIGCSSGRQEFSYVATPSLSLARKSSVGSVLLNERSLVIG
jgi:hypothetical protein